MVESAHAEGARVSGMPPPQRTDDSGARDAPPASRVATWTFALASLLLAAMALVAFGDVAMRVVGRPITGAYELTSLLVAALVYAGLPGVTLADEHVRAGIFAGWVDERARLAAALRWLRRITTALTMGVLAYAMARYAMKLSAVGDRAPFIDLPLAWVAAFGAALLALAAWLALRARAVPMQEADQEEPDDERADDEGADDDDPREHRPQEAAQP